MKIHTGMTNKMLATFNEILKVTSQKFKNSRGSCHYCTKLDLKTNFCSEELRNIPKRIVVNSSRCADQF